MNGYILNHLIYNCYNAHYANSNLSIYHMNPTTTTTLTLIISMTSQAYDTIIQCNIMTNHTTNYQN